MTVADPHGLLAGRPGVYRLDQLDVSSVTEAGWLVARADSVDDLDSFYRAVSSALALPSWFGHNLDALWDVLMDLRQPVALDLSAAQPMMENHPHQWRRVLGVLDERTRLPITEAQPFAVILTSSDGDAE